MAAETHVDNSIKDPKLFIDNNIYSTLNMLEYAKKLPNLKMFFYFSTDEVFGPALGDTLFKEWDRHKPTNPYSASKSAAEQICIAYENTYKLPIVITHTMNVFGERQHPEKFIPLVIQRVRDREKIRIHADPTKTVPGSRHYIHALDVAEGVMFILNNLKDYTYFEPTGLRVIPKFNLVGPEETDNLTLAKLIAEVQGKELLYELTDFHSARPGHDLRYALSGDLLKNLGWEPKIKFSERIRQVTEWSLEHNQWLFK